MNEKIKKAIDHLNKILPLEANQKSMSPEMQKIHRDILYSYVDLGRSLTRDEVSQRVDNIEDVIKILQKNDLVVFDERGEPIGAYPFTMEKRKHKISVNGHLIHCMCALDSLAISPMYDIELEINSVCEVSGDAIFIRQKGLDVLNHSDVQQVYFGINWGAASTSSCCANSLCMEMIFLKVELLANHWCDEDSEHRQIFTLDEAVKFAAGFFVPLVQH